MVGLQRSQFEDGSRWCQLGMMMTMRVGGVLIVCGFFWFGPVVGVLIEDGLAKPGAVNDEVLCLVLFI